MQNGNHIQLKAGKTATAFLSSDSRTRILLVAIFLMGIALAVRLYFLQVIQYDKWVAIAENQHNTFQELLADRGEIYMRDGEGRYPLAVNREYQMAYVVPRDVIEKDSLALELSRILGIF